MNEIYTLWGNKVKYHKFCRTISREKLISTDNRDIAFEYYANTNPKTKPLLCLTKMGTEYIWSPKYNRFIELTSCPQYSNEDFSKVISFD